MASKAVREARAKQFRESLVLEVDGADLRIKTKPLFRKELGKVLREIKNAAQRNVRAKHSRTGRMLSTIEVGHSFRNLAGGQRISGTVQAGGPKAPYTKFVHEGTDPHDIPARPGGFLRFPGPVFRKGVVGRKLLVKGQSLFVPSMGRDVDQSAYDDVIGRVQVPGASRMVHVKMVHHPGNPPKRFLTAAAFEVVARRYGGQVKRVG